MLGTLCKLVAELPDVKRKHAVVGVQGVDNGGLPSAGAGAGKQHDLTGTSLEDLGEPGGDFRDQSRKLRPTMVGNRPIHRAYDALGHIGRPWDLQEITTRHVSLLRHVNG